MSGIKDSLKKHAEYRFLVGELVSRDIKLKYRRSLLGYFWSLLNPLLTMLVISTVFSFIFKHEIENFPIYLLTGQILFQFFSESTSMAMGSVIQNASLLKKVYMPKYVFPLSRVLSSAVNLAFSLGALFIVMLFTGTPLSLSMLLRPFPIICILIFSVGVGLILSVYAVYFRDLLHIYGVFLTLLMYLTPIFYPVSLLPDGIKQLVNFNPLTQFVTCMRTIVLEKSPPDAENAVLCIVFSLLSLIAGAKIFGKKQKELMLHI